MPRAQLFYRIDGRGEPIVLLHGFLASSHYFKKLRAQLSATHTVISIDLLGFGRSPKPPSAAYDYDDHIRAVYQTLQALGVSRFTLVGHSLGALVALRYAVHHPAEVRQLVLFNPPMFIDSAQALQVLRATGLHYRVMLHSPHRHDIAWWVMKTLPRFPFNKRRPAINLTDMLRVRQAARRRTYQNIIVAAQFFPDAQRLTVPTLLVAGKRDRPEYNANAMGWAGPPAIVPLTVPGGHHTPMSRPLLAAALITRFMATYSGEL